MDRDADRIDAEDERLGAVMVTGALYTVLHGAQGQFPALTTVDIAFDENGQAQPELVVEVDFMKSPYRLTIERVPD